MLKLFGWLRVVIILPLALVACGETEEIFEQPPATVDISGTMVSASTILSGIQKTRPGQFTIDMLIRSNMDAVGTKFTDTYPPMPLLIGDIGIYQMANHYRFYLRRSKETLRTGTPNQWTRITIGYDGTEAKIFIDGVFVEKVADIISIKGPFTIGIGHAKRVWNGEIAFFDIYEGNIVPENFSRTSGRLTGPRLQDMDGLTTN